MDEIHLYGFQGMRVDNILSKTHLTKGALYHHFKNKQELGYAVVDELLLPYVLETWVKPLENTQDPIKTLIDICHQQINDNCHPEKLELGCPVNNLSQEMSPIDAGFHQRIQAIYQAWSAAMEKVFEQQIALGHLKSDKSAHDIAHFLLAIFQGMIGLSKTYQNASLLRNMVSCLEDYLTSLKNPPPKTH